MVNSFLWEEEEDNLINFKEIKFQIRLMEAKHYKIHRTYHRMDMYVIDAIHQGILNNIVLQTMTQIIINHVLKVFLKNSSGNK